MSNFIPLLVLAIILASLIALGCYFLRLSVLSRIGSSSLAKRKPMLWLLLGLSCIALALSVGQFLLLSLLQGPVGCPGIFQALTPASQLSLSLPDRFTLAISSDSLRSGVLLAVLAFMFTKDGISKLARSSSRLVGKIISLVELVAGTIFLGMGFRQFGSNFDFVINYGPVPGYGPLPEYITGEHIRLFHKIIFPAAFIVPIVTAVALSALGIILLKQGKIAIKVKENIWRGYLRLLLGILCALIGLCLLGLMLWLQMHPYTCH